MKLKKTRCPDCEQGIVYGPRGGRNGYWIRTVRWYIVDSEMYGSCIYCGACYEGRAEYQRQLKL